MGTVEYYAVIKHDILQDYTLIWKEAYKDFVKHL